MGEGHDLTHSCGHSVKCVCSCLFTPGCPRSRADLVLLPRNPHPTGVLPRNSVVGVPGELGPGKDGRLSLCRMSNQGFHVLPDSLYLLENSDSSFRRIIYRRLDDSSTASE